MNPKVDIPPTQSKGRDEFSCHNTASGFRQLAECTSAHCRVRDFLISTSCSMKQADVRTLSVYLT